MTEQLQPRPIASCCPIGSAWVRAYRLRTFVQSNTQTSTKHILVIGHRNDGDAIVETSLENGLYVHAHELQTKLPHGRPVHLELRVDYAAKTISVIADGITVVANEPLNHPPSSSTTFAPRIIAGQLSDNLAHPSACAVKTDDVTLDVAP